MGLLTQYHLEDLQKPLVSKITNLIDTKNVFAILETANLHNLQNLTETCHNFFDTHTEKLRLSEGFNTLSQVCDFKNYFTNLIVFVRHLWLNYCNATHFFFLKLLFLKLY